MGLLVKNFEHNGLELKDVYLGVELTMCNSSITNCTVHAYSSVDWRAKNKAPFVAINKSYRFTKEDLSTIPVYKLIYAALKDEYGDAKDIKDIDVVKEPVITDTLVEKDNIIIVGTTHSELDVISTVFPISRNKKTFKIVVPIAEYKEKWAVQDVYIYAEQVNMTDSKLISLFNKEFIRKEFERPIQAK